MWPNNVSLTRSQIEIVNKIRGINPRQRVHYHTSNGTLVTEEADPATLFIFKIAREADLHNTAVCMQVKRGKVFHYYVIGITLDAKRSLNHIQKVL